MQTGVGLTGSMWAWQQFGVEPDMFAFGKKTQVCGFAANHRDRRRPGQRLQGLLAASTRPGAATSWTWSAAARYLEIIAEENLVENARVVGEHLLARLRELAEEFPGVMTNVRGRGLFIAFDLPDKATRDRTLAACLENGMMGLASGAIARSASGRT